MTWDRPLREERGVPEDREEAEEKESEPWEDGASPLATGRQEVGWLRTDEYCKCPHMIQLNIVSNVNTHSMGSTPSLLLHFTQSFIQ